MRIYVYMYVYISICIFSWPYMDCRPQRVPMHVGCLVTSCPTCVSCSCLLQVGLRMLLVPVALSGLEV